MKQLVHILAAFFVSNSVQAKDLAECANLTHSGGGERDHTDVGAGVVQYRLWYLDVAAGSSQRLVIESCATGDAIFAEYHREIADADTLARSTVLNVGDEVYAVLHSAVKARDRVTFAQLETQFADVGAVVSRSVIEQESCACNRAYPDMRGSRQQFEWYQ